MAEINNTPRKLSLDDWERRYPALRAAALSEPAYGGPLGRHVRDGDRRLCKLQFDNSPAALRLWNFLLTEEKRLHDARRDGKILVGVMKDLGTAAALAFAFDEVVAFYPDGAWWIPCVMEHSAGLLDIADSLGVNESFCPVRAMLGAFQTENHFPIPDLLFCAVGAVCDDFSAIAQRLEGMGHPIGWWELPHRRQPESDEPTVILPGGVKALADQVAFVKGELSRIRNIMEEYVGHRLGNNALTAQIKWTNRIRRLLHKLRTLAYTAEPCPMPALEMLIAEMLAIHFCSDRQEAFNVLSVLLDEVRRRVQAGQGPLPTQAARIFWVNPVADLRMMNLLEECGGRVCGSEYLFTHALDEIPEELEPMEALARTALADPMIGSTGQRAQRICRDAQSFGAEAVLISRIPGASHCSCEASVIGDMVRQRLHLPVVEVEVPPLIDSMLPTLRTRLEALIELVRDRRP